MRRYPQLYTKLVSLRTADDYDTDDVMIKYIPELRAIRYEILRCYVDDVDELSEAGYEVFWTKILEWLRENPTKIDWVLL